MALAAAQDLNRDLYEAFGRKTAGSSVYVISGPRLRGKDGKGRNSQRLRRSFSEDTPGGAISGISQTGLWFDRALIEIKLGPESFVFRAF